jgi:1-acyl-sn-glycerol-3-phosphate acyltransferase
MKKFFFGLFYLPVFTILTIIAGIVCILVSYFSQRAARFISSQVWAYIVLDPAFIKVKVVSGKDYLPSPDLGGFIIFANHRSLLDIPIAARASGLQLSWVAKAALGKIPVFGWSLKRVHMLVDRGGGPEAAKQMVAEASARLGRGEIMAIFPEGTRNKTDEPILPFKKGAFILSKHTGAKLLPMAIYNSGYLWPSGSLVPRPGIIKVAFGPPIVASHTDSLNRIASEAQRVLEGLYKELQNSDSQSSDGQNSDDNIQR